ncbi:MAG: hypothetical protein IJY89_07270, partial [Clostridia bacterium]|nr:hypothetical protein [Clostridia bacterium]
YDLKSYGGDGWREFEAYLAFVIGEDSLTVDNYAVAQRDGDTAIYRINAPANGGAQPFVPKNNLIYSVDLHLNKTKDSDTVNVMICTDYKDPNTSIGRATYTFGSNENGWQNVAFDTPVSVVPGNTYYLVAQATKESGNVVWNGTLRKSSCPKSYNYDEAIFGGWTQGSSYLAFEILSFPTKTVAKSFEARGNKANSIDVTVFASKAGGRLKAEIRSDYTDPESALCSVQTELDHVGEKIYSLPLEKELALEYNRRYYLVVTFIDTNGRTRVMTDPAGMAKTYAFEESWMTIGYSLLCDVGFGADRSTIITLDGKTAGVQEIPTEGELITSVKVILARDEKTAGTVKATLYQGNDVATQKIDSKTLKIASLSTDPAFVTFSFDLPLTKTRATGNYYIRLETEGADGKVFWCGSTTIEGYETYVEKDGVKTAVSGEASFEAMKANLRLISDYTQTDATYMLIHAWVMYVNDNKGAPEDLEFIEQSYPIINDFANYYLCNNFYHKKMNLIINPSLEHSKKGRY